MTLLQPQTGKVPVPHPGTLTQPYWDGCARHELLFQRCGDVRTRDAHARVPLHATAPSQDLTWEKSAGTGEIYSWTTVWRPQMPSFEVPYVAIIVDMDEGWQILSNLVGLRARRGGDRHARRGRVPRDGRRLHAAVLPTRRD